MSLFIIGALVLSLAGGVRAWWQMALLIVGFTLLFSLFCVGWAISPGGG